MSSSFISPAFAEAAPAYFSNEELAAFFRENSGRQYRMDAVLGPCVPRNILSECCAATTEYHLLFLGTAYEPLAEHSPWLFELSMGHVIWEAIHGACRNWGFFGLTARERTVCRAHWKSLLNAVLPDDSLTHFRFYSSNVLLTTVSACTPSEIVWLTGPYSHLIVPCSHGEKTWAVIMQPGDGVVPEDAPAAGYAPRPAAWWQVTDAHVEAFREQIDSAYRRNMVCELWEAHEEHARIIDEQYAGLRNFVEEEMAALQRWGFADREHLSRALRSLMTIIAEDLSAPETRAILATARANPDQAIARLEALAQQRR